MVRLHADQENAAAIPRFIEEYERDFGADPRFQIHIRGLSRLGGPNDSNLRVFEREESSRIDEMRTLARSRGLNVMVASEDDAICYAAQANSFVVRANGRLNKCTVALEHPNNQVGVIREDGTVELNPDRMMKWMRGLRSEDPGELKCPMKGYADPIAAGAIHFAPRSGPAQTVSCEKAAL
jgi:uncharacterized protein